MPNDDDIVEVVYQADGAEVIKEIDPDEPLVEQLREIASREFDSSYNQPGHDRCGQGGVSCPTNDHRSPWDYV